MLPQVDQCGCDGPELLDLDAELAAIEEFGAHVITADSPEYPTACAARQEAIHHTGFAEEV